MAGGGGIRFLICSISFFEETCDCHQSAKSSNPTIRKITPTQRNVTNTRSEVVVERSATNILKEVGRSATANVR